MMFFLIIIIGILLRPSWAVSYVIGYQEKGYVGAFIGRYDDYLVENPRRIASISDANILTTPGLMCTKSWSQEDLTPFPDYKLIARWDLNCITTADDLNANKGGYGYYIGGLNKDGVTVAQCYVTNQLPELCDSDTVSDKNSKDCITIAKCE